MCSQNTIVTYLHRRTTLAHHKVQPSMGMLGNVCNPRDVCDKFTCFKLTIGSITCSVDLPAIAGCHDLRSGGRRAAGQHR